MTKEEKIEFYKLKLADAKRREKFAWLTVKYSEGTEGENSYEYYIKLVQTLEKIIERLENGEEGGSCETCANYCAKCEDGGNYCQRINWGWYDTCMFIFCEHYEKKETKQ